MVGKTRLIYEIPDRLVSNPVITTVPVQEESSPVSGGGK